MSNRKGGNDWRSFLDDEDDFDDHLYAGDFAIGGGPSASSSSRTGRNAPRSTTTTTTTTTTRGGRGRGGRAAAISASSTTAQQLRPAGYRAPLTTTIISRGRGRAAAAATSRHQPPSPGQYDIDDYVPTTQPHRYSSGRYAPPPPGPSVEEVPSSSIDDDSYDVYDDDISNSSSSVNHNHYTTVATSRGRGGSRGGGGGMMGVFQGTSSGGLSAASSSSYAAVDYDRAVQSATRHHHIHHHHQPECQILLATGGCEYGADCHFSHDVRSLQRQFPDAPLFNDPVVITAFHENRTALTRSSNGGGGGGGSDANSNSSTTSSHYRRQQGHPPPPPPTNGGSFNSRHNPTTASFSSSSSNRPLGGGFQPPRPATTNASPSSSSISRSRGGGGSRMVVGTDDNDTGVVRRGTGRPRGGGYLDSRVVEMSPGVFQIHRGSNDVDESDMDIFTRVVGGVGGNPHRNRGGFGAPSMSSSSAARTANPWMGAAPHGPAPTQGRTGRGGGRVGAGHNNHFDPFGGGRGGGGIHHQFEGGMDVDNMSYEELLQLQEDHGGDVPTPLPSNVLQSFPPVRYGTPAYQREVKAVLSSMRALNPTTTTNEKKTRDRTSTSTSTTNLISSGRPSVSGARPSTAIEIHDAEDEATSDDGDVVALTPPEARVSATEENPDSTPEIQDCLICCYSISQNPNEDEEEPPSSSSACSTSSRAPLVRVLLCGHEFHSDCILEWFQQKRTCPICKQDLSALYNQMFNISGGRQSGMY